MTQHTPSPAQTLVQNTGSIWLIAALIALGPVSTDMYLPALPTIANEFSASTSQAQLTLSIFFFGFALFHLVVGPLADRYGRKPIILIGFAIYIIASIACAMASSIEAFIFWRFVSSIGASAGPILGRTIIRDMHGPNAAKALSKAAAIMALAPAIAPVIGGYLLVFFAWQGIFYALVIYAIVIALCAIVWLPETLPKAVAIKPSIVFANYRMLFANARFVYASLACSFVFSGLFVFISAGSFLFINQLEVRAEHFGYYFMFCVFGYIIGNFCTARFDKTAAEKMLVIGAFICVFGALMMASSMLYQPSAIAIAICMGCYAIGVGFIMPQSMASALHHFSEIAGTASAMLGFIQMGIGAAIGIGVGICIELSVFALPLFLLSCALAASLSVIAHNKTLLKK